MKRLLYLLAFVLFNGNTANKKICPMHEILSDSSSSHEESCQDKKSISNLKKTELDKINSRKSINNNFFQKTILGFNIFIYTFIFIYILYAIFYRD
jgi:hypothetical protein